MVLVGMENGVTQNSRCSVTVGQSVWYAIPGVSSNQAGRPKDTGGATKASAEYHLPDYTEPEPGQRPPKGARLRRKVKLPETAYVL